MDEYYWKGKNIKDLTREELEHALRFCIKEVQAIYKRCDNYLKEN